jgi:hypothetical protein
MSPEPNPFDAMLKPQKTKTPSRNVTAPVQPVPPAPVDVRRELEHIIATGPSREKLSALQTLQRLNESEGLTPPSQHPGELTIPFADDGPPSAIIWFYDPSNGVPDPATLDVAAAFIVHRESAIELFPMPPNKPSKVAKEYESDAES